MQKLQNSILTLKAKTSGAELTSIIKDNIEYLWQADASIWARHAPVLFPIVGKLNNNTYKIGDKSYSLPQHGFARDMDFKLVSQTDTSIHYQLKYSDETLLKYPFKFEFNVIYTIKDDTIIVEYGVKNIDSEPIMFAVGGHPAFNCPLMPNEKFEDYNIVFEIEEELLTRIIDPSTGTIQNKTALVPRDKNKIAVKKSLFDNDALVFKDLKSKWVALEHKVTGKGVKMTIDKFPQLGIWAKKDSDKFVCLEPWQGVADHTNFEGQFADKEGMVVLNENGFWKSEYTVQII